MLDERHRPTAIHAEGRRKSCLSNGLGLSERNGVDTRVKPGHDEVDRILCRIPFLRSLLDGRGKELWMPGGVAGAGWNATTPTLPTRPYCSPGRSQLAMRAVAATGYAFTTPTPLTHARVNARPGADQAHDLRGVFGWSRRVVHGAIPDDIVAAMRAAGVLKAGRSTVRLSSLDGLLFLHSAYPTGAADSVFFGPDTYRFARAILAQPRRAVRRAVDVGCGAGPGAVLVARAYPEAEVFGVDINPAALRLTRLNAALAGVGVHAVHSDLLSGVPGAFDLIVSNPPYLVDPDARAYRHGGGDPWAPGCRSRSWMRRWGGSRPGGRCCCIPVPPS